MVSENRLKQRLYDGDCLFGAWIELGGPSHVELLAHMGYDYLLIDLEHGQGDLTELTHMLRAAKAGDTPCIVRVPWNDPVLLKRILDLGVDSVMIPSVESGVEAAAAVRACRYPPLGARGYAAPAVRASRYGLVKDYIHRAADNLLIILQIESAAAVKETAAIAAVDGVDVVFLGVNDLAGSIGRLEQLDHPDVRALVAESEAAIRASGKILGTVPSAGASWRQLFEAGYQLVPVAGDVGLIRDGAAASVAEQHQFHAARAKAAKPGSAR